MPKLHPCCRPTISDAYCVCVRVLQQIEHSFCDCPQLQKGDVFDVSPCPTHAIAPKRSPHKFGWNLRERHVLKPIMAVITLAIKTFQNPCLCQNCYSAAALGHFLETGTLTDPTMFTNFFHWPVVPCDAIPNEATVCGSDHLTPAHAPWTH